MLQFLLISVLEAGSSWLIWCIFLIAYVEGVYDDLFPSLMSAILVWLC